MFSLFFLFLTGWEFGLIPYTRDQGALGQRSEGNENFHMFFWSIFFPLPFGVGTNKVMANRIQQMRST